MKAWQRKRRWQQSGQGSGGELSGDDLRDMVASRAWKAAGPICRAAAGSNELAEAYHRTRKPARRA